jgi:hypothetical protein
VFGALILTRDILKIVGKQDQERRIQVHKIYNYLYGFSVNRLEHIIDNPYLMLLFVGYFKSTGVNRVANNPTMNKEREAYHEAI